MNSSLDNFSMEELERSLSSNCANLLNEVWSKMCQQLFSAQNNLWIILLCPFARLVDVFHFPFIP